MLSPLEIGAIGGVTVFVVKESFSLVGKIVNKRNGKDNSILLRPGRGDTCIKHGEKIVEHDTALRQLCKELIGTKDQMEKMRSELKEDMRRLYSILDDIKNKNIG